MNAARVGPGGLAELQHRTLLAALRASELHPETLEPIDLPAAVESLFEPLEEVHRALAAELPGALGNVAAIARWEIGRLLGALVTLAQKGIPGGMRPTHLDLAHLGALRHRIIGALEGLERALVEDGGLEPVLSGISFLETRRALAVRASLLDFRRTVRELGEPPPERLQQALRLVARKLEEMRTARGLKQLRVGDRIQVEELLRRIEGALAGEGEGIGVWRDVAAWAEVLLEVNRRAELRAHDGSLAARLLRELAARPQVIDQIAFRRQLELLRGRDDQLDRLLDADRPAAPELSAALQRIAAEA